MEIIISVLREDLKLFIMEINLYGTNCFIKMRVYITIINKMRAPIKVNALQVKNLIKNCLNISNF
jgi:hypothetical protein